MDELVLLGFFLDDPRTEPRELEEDGEESKQNRSP